METTPEWMVTRTVVIDPPSVIRSSYLIRYAVNGKVQRILGSMFSASAEDAALNFIDAERVFGNGNIDILRVLPASHKDRVFSRC